MKRYELTFGDGYQMTVIGSIEDVLFAVDGRIEKHGECIECKAEVGRSKYTGSTYERIW